MHIINGIDASLVNNPSKIKSPQKNSAKTVNSKEVVLPKLRKLILKESLLAMISEKCTSLSYPCFMMSTPKTNLNKKMAILNIAGE